MEDADRVDDGIETRRAQVESAYKILLDTPSGRIVLDDLMGMFYIHPSGVSDHNPDHAVFTNGQRSVVYHILRMAHTDITKKILDGMSKDADDWGEL